MCSLYYMKVAGSILLPFLFTFSQSRVWYFLVDNSRLKFLENIISIMFLKYLIGTPLKYYSKGIPSNSIDPFRLHWLIHKDDLLIAFEFLSVNNFPLVRQPLLDFSVVRVQEDELVGVEQDCCLKPEPVFLLEVQIIFANYFAVVMKKADHFLLLGTGQTVLLHCSNDTHFCL